jgi:hypothetical protein
MSKKKRKKHGGGCHPYEGYETEVLGTDCIQMAALAAAYAGMEEDSYTMGTLHRNCKRKAIPYLEFALDFEELFLPPPMKAEIVRANYATYLDAIKGKAFKAHITCKVI